MWIRVKEMYPQMMMGNGVLTDLADFNVPWKNASYVVELDLAYYWHSAQKIISPLVLDVSGNIQRIVNHSDLSELTVEQRTRIAGMIFTIFNRKWTKLWNVLETEYSPLHNYTMNEEEIIDGTNTMQSTDSESVQGTDTGTVDNAETGTISDNRTEGGTINVVTDTDITNTGTQSNAGTSNTNDGIFGFNSNNSVGSDTSDNTNSNLRTDNLASTEDTTEQTTRNLTDNNTRTLNTSNTETRNLASSTTTSNTASRTTEEDVTTTKTREGSTGIYAPQQLLSQEIELWQWNFFKQVFEDIDSILCLSVY